MDKKCIPLSWGGMTSTVHLCKLQLGIVFDGKHHGTTDDASVRLSDSRDLLRDGSQKAAKKPS